MLQPCWFTLLPLLQPAGPTVRQPKVAGDVLLTDCWAVPSAAAAADDGPHIAPARINVEA